MPLVARCDLFFPEHPESATNHQYLLFEDILVAPIWDTVNNQSSRTVWVPPGQWQDAWDGSQVEGPKLINVTQPFERIPSESANNPLHCLLLHIANNVVCLPA